MKHPVTTVVTTTQHHDCPDAYMVEYWYGSPYRYDGVSEWVCEHGRFGRWCNQELVGNEVEPPYCKGETHPQVAGVSE